MVTAVVAAFAVYGGLRARRSSRCADRGASRSAGSRRVLDKIGGHLEAISASVEQAVSASSRRPDEHAPALDARLRRARRQLVAEARRENGSRRGRPPRSRDRGGGPVVASFGQGPRASSRSRRSGRADASRFARPRSTGPTAQRVSRTTSDSTPRSSRRSERRPGCPARSSHTRAHRTLSAGARIGAEPASRRRGDRPCERAPLRGRRGAAPPRSRDGNCEPPWLRGRARNARWLGPTAPDAPSPSCSSASGTARTQRRRGGNGQPSRLHSSSRESPAGATSRAGAESTSSRSCFPRHARRERNILTARLREEAKRALGSTPADHRGGPRRVAAERVGRSARGASRGGAARHRGSATGRQRASVVRSRDRATRRSVSFRPSPRRCSGATLSRRWRTRSSKRAGSAGRSSVVVLDVDGLERLSGGLDREAADAVLGRVARRLSDRASAADRSIASGPRASHSSSRARRRTTPKRSSRRCTPRATTMARPTSLCSAPASPSSLERDGAETALGRAEHALWQAKQAGRGTSSSRFRAGAHPDSVAVARASSSSLRSTVRAGYLVRGCIPRLREYKEK